ncbi:gamma-glutamyltransferase [Tychonema sp. LEGE 07199]|uniref:gamma-glutamyltransferase n=1 Tax=unclassified Tychonema TaxID=2642144 RepID=UPI001882FD92|nr:MULTISPECIES: gamma-glutamyltransferase [unclassified Tychonema]MBE9122312.1 gamma-glutamyltransferase [Tychonema sp. LEGE 07199]MBE9130305.1 gamma-glutamyltransferase [Tychonema sp. LEGE 07196]
MFFKLSGKVRIYTCFLTVLLFGGCQQQLQPKLQQRSKQGMAVSAHPLASAAGLRVLQEGGNAVDAAAATALAISVVEPFSAGIGGGGFLLLRRAETGTVQALDFRERAPKRAGRDMYLDKQGKVRPRASRDGHLAAGIPGTVAGLYTVHREYGKLPWARVVAPAIALAENGFPVSSRFTKAVGGRVDAIEKNRAARDVFTRGGILYQPGELLVQRDLARTLRQISQNPQSFYRGDIARAIASDMAKNGGIMTLEDLKNYTPIWRNPVCGNFRAYQICAMSPPSSGGVHLLQILNILGDTDLKRLGRKSPDTLHLLAESMRIAYADRAEYLGDPDFVSVPVKALTSKNYGKFRRSQIDMTTAKPSTEVKAVDAKTLSRFVRESPETTHLTVVDSDRNVVSLTFTVNGGFGAAVVAAGTGILLNNEMDDFAAAPGVPNLSSGLVGGEANSIAPGKTPLSSMTPVIVTENGKFRLAAGAPGGSTIITTVLQIVLNVLVYDMNVGEAVSAPRIHHQWLPDRLMVERGGFDAATLSELRRRGHQIVERDGWGNANAIVLTPDGWLEGAADPRGEGEAKGF